MGGTISLLSNSELLHQLHWESPTLLLNYFSRMGNEMLQHAYGIEIRNGRYHEEACNLITYLSAISLLECIVDA
ncbi:hypothetical protein Smp_179100 [Schistosoma mansoni]|uniref:hypothetical protein n=1 Tax=Schistosoma mansoni TaxID=6183 RepID=UPI0001A622E7|nr:hypothetical protein Smp_179100 [Schistosoma mansoni]|eukprot:XP_018653857.1 hypothetical protein Smp_179100 [Schistosoma mansoni]